MTTNTPAEIFAVDFAQLAREIAMDIFPLGQILALHQLSGDEWMRIRDHPTFQQMFGQMLIDWNSATSTAARVKIKAATGLESQLETYIREIGDESIPLVQRVEAGKFLARLGELDGNRDLMGVNGGDKFQITLNIGEVVKQIDARVIEGVLPEATA